MDNRIKEQTPVGTDEVRGFMKKHIKELITKVWVSVATGFILLVVTSIGERVYSAKRTEERAITAEEKAIKNERIISELPSTYELRTENSNAHALLSGQITGEKVERKLQDEKLDRKIEQRYEKLDNKIEKILDGQNGIKNLILDLYSTSKLNNKALVDGE